MESGSRQRMISDRARLAAMLLVLAALLVGCKGVLLPLPGLDPRESLRWLVRVSVVGSADVAYVMLLGLALVGLWQLARRLTPRRMGWFWALAWTAVLVSAVYGAASVAIFRHLEIQLTLPMLHFLAQWREMATSAEAVVSWRTWLALASAVGMMVAGYRLLAWLLVRRPIRFSHAARILLATALVGYFGLSLAWERTHWQDHSLWQARLAKNPHLRLIESLVTVTPLADAADFPPDASEFDDFRPPPSTPRSTGSHPRKNIVLVVLESVSAKWTGLYGAPYANTPNLQRLARRAMVFDNVYSQCPSSAKAMVTMLCGSYPRMDWREQTRSGQMPVDSLADVARRSGYRTAFFHPGDWSSLAKVEFLKDHGFECVRDARDLPHKERSWGQYDSWLLDEMCRWIDGRDSPFLAVAWTVQTHHPYPVEGTEQDYGVKDAEMNRYLNGIRESDALVGRLWEAIRQRGLAQSTVLAVIGDHGDAFGQHHQRLHIFGLYEENVHVPLVIVHDDPRLPVGRFDTIAEQIDLPATLAECAGLPPSPQWQGRSLLSGDRRERAYFYVVWDPVLFGVRQGRYKYILEPGRGDALYDLAADPGELEDLAGDHPELCAALKRRLHALVAYHGDTPTFHQPNSRRRPSFARRPAAEGARRR